MSALLPPGTHAVATEIGEETGGFILPNDRIDVILARKLTGARPASEAILRRVRVLAIDESGEETEPVEAQKTATLALTPKQAETIARARPRGTISLALRRPADAVGADVPGADLRRRSVPTAGAMR
jgi:pilus assembly protein CpaB